MKIHKVHREVAYLNIQRLWKHFDKEDAPALQFTMKNIIEAPLAPELLTIIVVKHQVEGYKITPIPYSSDYGRPLTIAYDIEKLESLMAIPRVYAGGWYDRRIYACPLKINGKKHMGFAVPEEKIEEEN